VLFIGVSINKNEYYQIHEFVENNTLYNLLHKEKQIKSILKSVDNNKIYDNKNIIDDKSNNNEKTKKILNKNEISNNKLDNNLNNLNASINNIDINDDNEKEEINIKNNKTYENFHNLEEVSQGKILFQIAYEISIVLRYIHSRNIIHCNLRSDNILLDEEYHIKLGDFSLSKIVNFFSDNNKEEKYFLENKYEWTPPEILKNGKFEESSDIYSFGIILYELFTGEIPHKSIGDNEIIGLSKYLSNVNYRFLITLIKKCINEDPKNRPSLENISNFLYKASNLYDKREFIFEELANFILN
jgi:serine/threonine protein kinase